MERALSASQHSSVVCDLTDLTPHTYQDTIPIPQSDPDHMLVVKTHAYGHSHSGESGAGVAEGLHGVGEEPELEPEAGAETGAGDVAQRERPVAGITDPAQVSISEAELKPAAASPSPKSVKEEKKVDTDSGMTAPRVVPKPHLDFNALGAAPAAVPADAIRPSAMSSKSSTSGSGPAKSVGPRSTAGEKTPPAKHVPRTSPKVTSPMFTVPKLAAVAPSFGIAEDDEDLDDEVYKPGVQPPPLHKAPSKGKISSVSTAASPPKAKISTGSMPASPPKQKVSTSSQPSGN